MSKIHNEIKKGNQRTIIAIAGASILMSAFIVYGQTGPASSMLMGVPIISWVLGGIGSLFLVIALQD